MININRAKRVFIEKKRFIVVAVIGFIVLIAILIIVFVLISKTKDKQLTIKEVAERGEVAALQRGGDAEVSEIQKFIEDSKPEGQDYIDSLIILANAQVNNKQLEEAYYNLKKADELWQSTFTEKQALYSLLATVTREIHRKSEAVYYTKLMLNNLDPHDEDYNLVKQSYEKIIKELEQ